MGPGGPPSSTLLGDVEAAHTVNRQVLNPESLLVVMYVVTVKVLIFCRDLPFVNKTVSKLFQTE